MKRAIAGIMVLLLSVSLLSACGGDDPEEKRYAFVTGAAGAETSAVTEQTWAGVSQAAELKPCVATLYAAEEDTLDDYLKQMKSASKDGARLIVASGAEMGPAVYEGQLAHKKLHFVLVEGTPMSQEAYDAGQGGGAEDAAGSAEAETGSDSAEAEAVSAEADGTASAEGETSGMTGDSAAESESAAISTVSAEESKDSDAEEEASSSAMNENTCVIRVAQRDAGFLAGYALVTEGFTRIGFMGYGTEDDEYGNGLIAGAEKAAQERALGADAVTVRYKRWEDDKLSPVKMDEAMTWYGEGTQIIFSPSDGIRVSVEKAAEHTENVYVAAAGFEDKSMESDRLVLTAVADYKTAIQKTIQDFENDAFRGGEIIVYGAADGCVGVAVNFFRFTQFTETVYMLLMNNLNNGSARVTPGDLTGGTGSVLVNIEA